MLRKWGLLFSALLMAIVLSILAIIPPSPKGIDTPLDQFSSGRAMNDVRVIAAKPHPTGSEENAKVRDYLVGRLEALGADVEIKKSLLGERSLKRLNKWSGETKTAQEIFNIIGTIPGKDSSKPAILLMAHHDTVWGSPGAADATIGLASILEMTRAFKTDGLQERDLIILFTDAEELGLVGARAFFKENLLRDKIGAVINFEARGGGGTANMFQTSAQNGDAVKLFARSVREPSTSSLSTFVYSVLPNDTDLTPALEKDYVAYNIANIGLAEYYHSPKIDADALDEATLQHMGSQGLDLTRALLAADELPAPKPDATFFDAFGMFTVIYPSFWGWIFLAVAGVCFIFSMDRKASRKDILGGSLKMLGFLLIGGPLLYGLNKLSGAGNSSNYYDRLAAIPKLEIMALFLCIAMFFIIFGSKFLSQNERIGAAIPIFIIGVLGQAFAPTATYFISIPLLLCGISALLLRRWPKGMTTSFILVLSASLIVGYMLSLGHLLMLGVGPDMPSIAILPAAILVLAIFPLYKGLKDHARKISVAGGVASVLLALWVRFDPIASTIPLY